MCVFLMIINCTIFNPTLEIVEATRSPGDKDLNAYTCLLQQSALRFCGGVPA